MVLNRREIGPEQKGDRSRTDERLVQNRWEFGPNRWEIGPEQMIDWSRKDGRFVQNKREIGLEHMGYWS